ncbi:MAG: tetratricopeptide repeat protein [Ferruginibacter sp.]
MKKLLTLIMIFAMSAFAVQAQSIKEARNEIYYQRYETAKTVLQSVISNDKTPEAFYLLGEIYLKEKNNDAARKILQQGLDYVKAEDISMKKAPLVHIGWAHLLLNEGKTAEARQLMEEVLNAGKNKDADALYAAGRANIDSKYGDITWAVATLGKAVNRDRKNPAVYTALADAYKKAIDGSNAVIFYDKALSVDSKFAEAMYKKGRLYKSHNNPQVYLEKFRTALTIDENYAPAMYELYYYYFYTDVAYAKEYLDKYEQVAEKSIELDYMKTDLLFVSQKYPEAISSANAIMTKAGKGVKPRIYKLLAYSQAYSGDSVSALKNMNTYFEKQIDTSIVAKDFELKAKLLETLNPDKSLALEWYKKAVAAEEDKKERTGYMYALADIQKELGNREREAVWREAVFTNKEKPTNLDIYKWGMALYSDEDYVKADSVFAIYESKYPEQIHGYLWRARCNALIDTAMTMGLAVPHYVKLARVADSVDAQKNKAVILRAYNYLGIYEANITKNYPVSLGYFEKMLAIDPANADGLKFSEILKGWIEKANAEDANTEKETKTQTGTATNAESGK